MYAVDIDQGLLTHIAERAAKLQLTNIRTVLGAFTDPKLPAPVDLAFMNDVLHHVQTHGKQTGSPLEGDAIVRVFERIIDEARRIERATANKQAGNGEER